MILSVSSYALEGRDLFLQVQAASFYTVCLVWRSHVIGQNKLCCDWSDCR